jgi:hypothetical protein
MANVMVEGVNCDIAVASTLSDVIGIIGVEVPSMSDDICWHFDT